jgi:hypothetical protein
MIKNCFHIFHVPNKRLRFQNIVVALCVLAGILSFVPFLLGSRLRVEIPSDDASPSVDSLVIKEINAVMIGVSLLMAFDCFFDKPWFELSVQTSLPRWLMVVGILSTSFLFAMIEDMPPNRRLTFMISCMYCREFFIGAPIAFHVIGIHETKSLWVKSFQAVTVVLGIGMATVFLWSPFHSGNSFTAQLSIVIAVVFALLVCAICFYGVFKYLREREDVYQTGLQKFSVLHFLCLFVYIFGNLFISMGFGSTEWAQATPGEIISYFILDLAVSAVIFILPSRMAQYDAIIMKVCFE